MFHVKHISVKHLPCRRRVFHTLKTIPYACETIVSQNVVFMV